MKKLLLIALSIMMVLSFAACGEDKKLSDAADKVQDALSATDENGNLDQDAVNDALEDYNDALDNAGSSVNNKLSVADYVKQTKSAVEKQSSDTFTIELCAEGNNIVYKYTYKVPVADNAKDLLDNQIAQIESTTQSAVNIMKKECSALENVVYEYYTMNGKLIATYTFQPNSLGSSSSSSNSSNSDSSNNSGSSGNSDTSSNSGSNNMSVADYVNTFKADAEKLASNDTISLELVAEGNDIVYKFTYKVPVADNAKELLDEEIKPLGSTNQTLANTMKKECPSLGKFVYEYYSMDGDLIARYGWTAK